MSKTPRVPTPNSPREVEDWRIRLAAGVGKALIQSDVKGTDDEITVVINTDGTITLSIPDTYLPANIFGTTNQITVTDNGDGTITLSTPQDIDTDSDVEFGTIGAGMTPIVGYISSNGHISIHKLNDLDYSVIIAHWAVTGGSISAWGPAGYTNMSVVGNNVLLRADTHDGSTSVKFVDDGDVEQAHIDSHGGAEFNTQQEDADHVIRAVGNPNAFFLQGSDGYIGFGTGTPTEQIEINGNVFLNTDNDKSLFGAGKDMSVFYDGTDGNIKTDEVAASDLKITCGANKTIELQNVVYDDLYFEIAPKTTGAGKPTLASFSGNINQWTMAVNDITELRPTELKHDWKEGTEIEIHVHWASNGVDGTNRGVKWEIDYTWSNGAMHATAPTAFAAKTTLSVETQIPANTPDKTYFYTSVVSFTPATGKIGAGLLMSLKRIASVIDPTPANSPWVIMVGVHYQINTIGSRQIGIK
jgi:hypothetical protein